MLNGNDYGTILFDALSQPAPFVQYEEPVDDLGEMEDDGQEGGEEAPKEYVLTIIADPLTDKESGETLMLDDGEREQYDELHLRLTTTLIDTLKTLGYTEIVYEVENADLHIPLEALLAEIPIEQEPEAEVISIIEGEEDENGETGEDVEELEMELTPTTLHVDAYDICIEQSEVAVLTERELTLLDDYTPLMPTYRVHVRGVIAPEDGESAPVVTRTDENGDTYEELPPVERLPENGYPVGMVLNVQPLDALEAENDGETEEETDAEPAQAIALFISTMDTLEDADLFQANPAEFVEIDGVTYAQIIPEGDGLYGVGYPVPEEEELVDFN